MKFDGMVRRTEAIGNADSEQKKVAYYIEYTEEDGTKQQMVLRGEPGMFDTFQEVEFSVKKKSSK